MGLFGRARSYVGVADKKLLREGTLARGEVVRVEPTHMTAGNPNGVYGLSTVCTVTVRVVGLEQQPAYEASCVHAIPQIYLPQLQTPGAAIAVRVDPADPQHIELDLTHDVPPAPGADPGPAAASEITLVSDDGTEQRLETHKSTFTAVDILATGSPCTVDVLAVIPLDQRNDAGLEVTGLVLSVHRDGVPPYQAQIGTPIPADAVAKVVVGASLPARWVSGPGLPTDVNLVCPDWARI